VPARLRRMHGDPWEDFDSARRPINAALLKRVGIK
jgi:hypothetical protein